LRQNEFHQFKSLLVKQRLQSQTWERQDFFAAIDSAPSHRAISAERHSGPIHTAAAVINRLLSIHTWTDPRRAGPYNSEA